MVKPGVATNTLDKFVFDFGRDHNAYPAPLHYRGYRKSICTSINHVVCHGIPDDKPLREGDIVNIDVTYVLDGWHGDFSRMFCAGVPPRRAQRLIDVTYECLLLGIAAVQARGDHRRHRRRDPILCGDPSAARWCATSAAMASAGCSTTSRMCFMLADAAKARR